MKRLARLILFATAAVSSGCCMGYPWGGGGMGGGGYGHQQCPSCGGCNSGCGCGNGGGAQYNGAMAAPNSPTAFNGGLTPTAFNGGFQGAPATTAWGPINQVPQY